MPTGRMLWALLLLLALGVVASLRGSNAPRDDAESRRERFRLTESGKAYAVRVRSEPVTAEEADTLLGWAIVRTPLEARTLAFVVARGPAGVAPAQWRHGPWRPPGDTLFYAPPAPWQRQEDIAESGLLHLAKGEVLAGALTSGNRPVMLVVPERDLTVLERALEIVAPREVARPLAWTRLEAKAD